MILVTVGTSLPFDALIETVDRLVKNGQINERVICQIGHGAYRPKNCDHFLFKPCLNALIKEASLIIGHGGTGTVFSALVSGKPLIAVANPGVQDNHQVEFLAYLSQRVHFLWTTNLNNLPNLIQAARSNNIQTFKGERLVDELRAILNET